MLISNLVKYSDLCNLILAISELFYVKHPLFNHYFLTDSEVTERLLQKENKKPVLGLLTEISLKAF